MFVAVPASSSAASAMSFDAPRIPFTSSTFCVCNHIAPMESTPNHRCQRYIRSSPPKATSRTLARVERMLLHAISMIDTEPMKRAKATGSSLPTASLNAHQPTTVLPTARIGPTQWMPGRGGAGTDGRSSRQSRRVPRRERTTFFISTEPRFSRVRSTDALAPNSW